MVTSGESAGESVSVGVEDASVDEGAIVDGEEGNGAGVLVSGTADVQLDMGMISINEVTIRNNAISLHIFLCLSITNTILLLSMKLFNYAIYCFNQTLG